MRGNLHYRKRWSSLEEKSRRKLLNYNPFDQLIFNMVRLNMMERTSGLLRGEGEGWYAALSRGYFCSLLYDSWVAIYSLPATGPVWCRRRITRYGAWAGCVQTMRRWAQVLWVGRGHEQAIYSNSFLTIWLALLWVKGARAEGGVGWPDSRWCTLWGVGWQVSYAPARAVQGKTGGRCCEMGGRQVRRVETQMWFEMDVWWVEGEAGSVMRRWHLRVLDSVALIRWARFWGYSSSWPYITHALYIVRCL
jgi:hypothetical protein